VTAHVFVLALLCAATAHADNRATPCAPLHERCGGHGDTMTWKGSASTCCPMTLSSIAYPAWERPPLWPLKVFDASMNEVCSLDGDGHAHLVTTVDACLQAVARAVDAWRNR